MKARSLLVSLVVVGALFVGAAPAQSALRPAASRFNLIIEVQSAQDKPVANAAVVLWSIQHAQTISVPYLTNQKGLVGIDVRADLINSLQVRVAAPDGRARWSDIAPSLLEGKTEYQFLVTLPASKPFVDLTGSWRPTPIGDSNPSDYWHLEVTGPDHFSLTAIWGSTAAGHTGLHGTAVATLDDNVADQETYTGPMVITEGSAKYQGNITFDLRWYYGNLCAAGGAAGCEALVMSYKETVLNGVPYNGQSAQITFIRVA